MYLSTPALLIGSEDLFGDVVPADGICSITVFLGPAEIAQINDAANYCEKYQADTIICPLRKHIDGNERVWVGNKPKLYWTKYWEEHERNFIVTAGPQSNYCVSPHCRPRIEITMSNLDIHIRINHIEFINGNLVKEFVSPWMNWTQITEEMYKTWKGDAVTKKKFNRRPQQLQWR